MKELDPLGTLKRINTDSNDAICDVGAGSGIFTIPAAQLTSNRVYALETDHEMLEVIKEKAKIERLTNIDLIPVEGDNIQINDKTVNLVLLVTVLHEIENKSVFLNEMKRILKTDGRIMLIEFYKHETPFGPPVSHRISREEVIKVMAEKGFLNSKEFALGDNFYCMVFENGANKNENI
ncbi:class I SAM-dependent methyltransferase [Sinanaerobacter chloroacetimidivorans]|uniref:class I SAM-dependent methyltransferase n=1 Tax=Sinanaerobacter chloroacetimidivorans TaxID=2818044 RepID=UPI001D03DDE2|nr:methyltransferase domain-containing protein [Sinanaerobacter chloroacetimidivorans]